MKFIVGFLLLLTIAPVNVIFGVWPINSLWSGLASLGIVVAALAVLLIVLARREIFHVSTLSTVILVVATVAVLSVFPGGGVWNVSATWLLVALSTALSLVLVAGEALPVHRKALFSNFIPVGLVIGCGLYSLFSLVIYYGLGDHVIDGLKESGNRLKGVWGQPNLTTTTLWLGLVSVLYLGTYTLSLVQRGLLYLGGFSMLWALALAASRTNVLFLIALCCIGGVAWAGKAEFGKKLGKIWLSGAAIILLSLLIVPMASQPLEAYLVERGWIEERQSVSLLNREAFDNPRIIEHRKIFSALDEFSLQQWVFGHGHGQYAAFSMEQPVEPYRSAGSNATHTHSHNLFSNVFVEWGLVGLTVVVGICVSVMRRLWRFRKQPQTPYIATVLAVLFLHSMTEYPLWYPWFLFVTALFMVPLYGYWKVPVTSRWLFPAAGILVLVVTGLVGWNVASNAWAIQQVATSDEQTREQYRELSLLANDSLLGPYAVLTKYRAFPPEKTNLEWQLKEVRRIANWRPLDLVKVREATLLMMLNRVDEACEVSRNTSEHYPASAPILVEKAVRIEVVDMAEVATIANCVEEGLAVWDETLTSMQQKNQERIDRLRERWKPSNTDQTEQSSQRENGN